MQPETIYQRESVPIPGTSVTDINKQAEPERDRNSLAWSAASGNLNKAGSSDGIPDVKKAFKLSQTKGLSKALREIDRI